MNGFNLANTTLCQGLKPSEVKILAGFLTAKDYNYGDRIFKLDTTRDKLVIIANGSVKLQSEIAGQNELIASFRDGDILGEMALLKKEQHKHFLEVSSPRLQVWELSAYSWQEIKKNIR